MILSSGKQAEVVTLGQDTSSRMTIDAQDEAVLMSILSEGLYKDAIGSVVREWTSNALDSHTEAGVDEPVIVSIEQDAAYQWWFKVTDFGVGISEDRMKNVVAKYAASTKRHTNTLLGAYGLGLKSALSYTDSFLFVTRYNGKEYQYMMYKGEDGTDWDTVYTKDTTERNGTCFMLGIKNYNDVREFTLKCKQQLCYFEKVYFQINGIDNNFKIIKGDGWKYSTLSQDSNIHLCLDNVYYSIDYAKLGIQPLNCAVGLEFQIGEGIEPIPSREDIKYTPSSKQLILDRLYKVANKVVDDYNKDVVNLKNFLDLEGKMGEKFWEIMPGKVVSISPFAILVNKSIAPAKVEGIELLDVRQIWTNVRGHGLEDLFSSRGMIDRYHKKHYAERDYFNRDVLQICRRNISKQYMITEEYPTKVEIEYLKDTATTDVYLIKLSEFKLRDYIMYLNLDIHPKEEWIQRIKEYQRIVKELLGQFNHHKDYKPTEEWLKKRKDERTWGGATRVKKEEIYPKVGITPQKSLNGQHCVFSKVDKPILIANALKMKGLHIYDREENKVMMDKLFVIDMGLNHKVYTNLVSERDYQRLQTAKLHNWISYDEFMEGNTKPFQRYATAALINKLIEKHSKIFGDVDFIGEITTPFAEKLKTLSKYRATHYRYGDEKLYAAMYEVAKEYDLWDRSVYNIYLEVERDIELFDFLNVMPTFDRYFNQTKDKPIALKLAVDILKFRKFKLNFEHYQPRFVIIDDALEEKELDLETD